MRWMLGAIGIVLALTAGCGSKSGSPPMDARVDRADSGAITDTGPRTDVADADQPPTDGTPTEAPEAGPPDTPQDTATADATPPDAPSPTDTTSADTTASDVAMADATMPDRAGPDADADAADATADRASADMRPPDPCASNSPLTTVGCNGEPPGPAPPNTFGGRCSFTDASASGTCTNPSHVCAEGICVLLCEPTRVTEVSTGGCPTGSRCWNTGLLAFCFPDCRAPADCATAVCDSGRGICRGP